MTSQTRLDKILEKNQTKAPVKTVRAANELGLNVYVSNSLNDDVSGMIKKSTEKGGESGYAIFVNGKHPNTRKRFTIAHEIGHYLLHKEMIGDGIIEDALLRATGLTNSVERQANSFAADFLMPWKLIEKAMDDGINSIEGLANLFEVSRDAMSYRILGVSYSEAQTTGRV
jgi:Zn-dependent peptidase ImmA (M78 family)